MSREVEASVANVLDSYRVALNVGATEGVSVGDHVTLWREVEVTDPQTGERLGAVRIDNIGMELKEVQDRLSVASVRAGKTLFANFAFTTPRRRIGTGDAEDRVVVRVGDAATIYVEDLKEES